MKDRPNELAAMCPDAWFSFIHVGRSYKNSASETKHVQFKARLHYHKIFIFIFSNYAHTIVDFKIDKLLLQSDQNVSLLYIF